MLNYDAVRAETAYRTSRFRQEAEKDRLAAGLAKPFPTARSRFAARLREATRWRRAARHGVTG